MMARFVATALPSESPAERTLQCGEEASRREERAEGKLTGPRTPKKERIMLRKSLAAMFMSLFITGAAFAGTPASGHADTPEKAAKLSEALSVLHAEIGRAHV